MVLNELKNIDNFLSEIKELKERSKLLDEILGYYDAEKMTFIVPEKWKGNRVRPDKLPAETPRHLLLENIKKRLTDEELRNLGVYDYF